MQKGRIMSSLVALNLQMALDRLVNQIPRNVVRDDGSTMQVWDDCLLDQLASMGQESTRGGSSHSKPDSKPPIALDVISLRLDMHNAIARMWRANLSDNGTAGQLRTIIAYLIDSRQWARCDEWAERLDTWAMRINDLSGVERARSRPLATPCPACGERWQYDEQDGETVRRPILSALFEGDVMLSLDCASCGSWVRGAGLDELVTHMLAA
jgi:hypothetical protein